jgi:hypothetical protein
MPRYTTTGIPPTLAAGSALGLSAFMPHFNRLAASGAQAFKGGVVGLPGTAEIRIAGIPNTIPSPDIGDIVLGGQHATYLQPNSIWPNLYYDVPTAVGGDGYRYYPGAGMPVQVYDPVRPQDTTMIPVPATDLRGVYLSRSALMAGGISGEKARGNALKQAFNFVRWPNRRTGNGPGTGSSTG